MAYSSTSSFSWTYIPNRTLSSRSLVERLAPVHLPHTPEIALLPDISTATHQGVKHCVLAENYISQLLQEVYRLCLNDYTMTFTPSNVNNKQSGCGDVLLSLPLTLTDTLQYSAASSSVLQTGGNGGTFGMPIIAQRWCC